MATYEKNFKVKKGLDVSSGSINVTNDANSSSYADLAIFHTGNLEVGRIAYTANDNLQIGGSAANHAGLNFIQNAIKPMSALSETNNAIDIGDSNHKFRSLYLTTDIDAGNFQLDGGAVKISTETNAKPLEISRSGSSASQVMKVGVEDTAVKFNYIEDTNNEGSGAFGQYQFILGGTEGESSIIGLKIQKDNLTVPGDITVAGDINVSGSLNTTSTTNLLVEDKTITLNRSDSDSSATAHGSGIIIQDAVDASTDASILWDATPDEFDFSHGIQVNGVIRGSGSAIRYNNDTGLTIDSSGDQLLGGATPILDIKSNLQTSVATKTVAVIRGPGNHSNIVDRVVALSLKHSSEGNSGESGKGFDLISKSTQGFANNPSFIIAESNGQKRIHIQNNGDINFYEDTGATAKFHWDAADERLGLGTTTPSYALDVNAGTSDWPALFKSTDNKAGIIVADNDTTGYFGAENGNIFMGKNAGTHADNLNVKMAETNEVNMIRVGIGTTSPSTALSIHRPVHVTPNSTTANLHLEDTSALGAGRGGSIVFTGVYTGTTSLTAGPYIKAYKMNATDGDYGFGLKLAVRENNSTQKVALTINDTQLIGIGTESPSAKLHVFDGNIELQSPSGSGGRYFSLNATDTGGRDYRLISTNTSHGSLGGGKFAILDNDVSGNDAAKTRIAIDNAGNVGIGTTTPARKFVVRDSGAQMSLLSDTNGSSVINFGDTADDNAGRIHYNNDTDAMFIRTATVDRITILSSGNVGIGSSDPTHELQVVGNQRIEGQLMVGDSASSNAPATGAAIHIKNTGTGARIRIEDSDSSNTYWDLLVDQGDSFAIYEDSTERVTFKEGGKIGFGEDSPTATYEFTDNNANAFSNNAHAWSQATSDTLAVVNTNNADGDNQTSIYMRTNGNSGAASARMILRNLSAGSSSLHWQLRDNGHTDYTQDKMSLTGDGKLTVTGNAEIQGADIDISSIIRHIGDTNTYFGFHGNDLWRVVTGGVERFEVGNTGVRVNDGGEDYDFTIESNNQPNMFYVDGTNDKIGIGTATPSDILTINGDAKYIAHYDGTNYAFKLGADSSGDGLIALYNSSGVEKIKLYGEANSNSYINADGMNFGVGTSSPTAKLHVYDDRDITAHPEKKGIRLAESSGDWLLSLGISGLTNTGFAIRDNALDTYPFVIRETTGRVGIGTTQPAAKLDVEGGATGTTDGNTATAAIFRAGRQNFILQDERTADGSDWNDCTFKLIAQIDSTNHQSIDFVNDTNFAEHIDIRCGNQVFNSRFTSDSKLGIGTTSPAEKLDVAGKARAATFVADDNEMLQRQVDGWTAGNRLHDIIYSHYQSNIGDYVYLKAAGNSTSGHGIIVVADNATYIGSDNLETGSVANNAATPITNTHAVIKANSYFNGNLGVGVDTGLDHCIHLKKDNPVIRIQEGDVTNGYADIRYNSTSLRLRSRADTAHGSIRFEGNNGTDTVEYARFKNNGNFGIGVTDPSHKLEVNGSFAATTKSFDIEHPTKEGKRLHHGVLEGPEHAVYVRGRSSNGIIELPDYWTGLVHEHSITVQLTPIGKSSDLYVKDIIDNTIEVEADCEYFYFVQAERKDVERFEVEYDGSV